MKDFTTLTIEFPLHTALLPKYAVNTLFMYIKHLKIHHSWCYQPQSMRVCAGVTKTSNSQDDRRMPYNSAQFWHFPSTWDSIRFHRLRLGLIRPPCYNTHPHPQTYTLQTQTSHKPRLLCVSDWQAMDRDSQRFPSSGLMNFFVYQNSEEYFTYYITNLLCKGVTQEEPDKREA